jgi:uncharacterized protein YbjT (DUF2867 family)
MTVAESRPEVRTAVGVLRGSWDAGPAVGPDDLSPDDMARIMSEVLQRPIHFQQVPAPDFKARMMQFGGTYSSRP